MAGINDIVVLGFGSWGSVNDLPTLGFSIGGGGGGGGGGIQKGAIFGSWVSGGNQFSAGIEKGGVSGAGQIAGEEF